MVISPRQLFAASLILLTACSDAAGSDPGGSTDDAPAITPSTDAFAPIPPARPTDEPDGASVTNDAEADARADGEVLAEIDAADAPLRDEDAPSEGDSSVDDAAEVDAQGEPPPVPLGPEGQTCSVQGWCWASPSGPAGATAIAARPGGDVLLGDATSLRIANRQRQTVLDPPFRGATSIYAPGRDDLWVISSGDCATRAVYRGAPMAFIRTPYPGRCPVVVTGTGPHDVFIGDASGDLVHYDGRRFVVYARPSATPIVDVVAARPGEVWVLTATSVERFDGTRFAVEALTPKPSQIRSGSVIGGTTWIATDAGAYRRVGASFVPVASVGTHRLLTTVFGCSGNDVWAFEASKAWDEILRWTGSGWAVERLLDEPRLGAGRFHDGACDAQGDLWFAGTSIARGRPGTFGLVTRPSAWNFHALFVKGDEDLDVFATRRHHWDGKTWTDAEFFLRFEHAGVEIVDRVGQVTFAVGRSGIAARHDGTAWVTSTRAQTGADRPLLAVWAIDADQAVAVGEIGQVLVHDRSGWKSSSAGLALHLRAVHGTSATDVWAVGDRGTIVHFDGKTWATSPSGTTDPLLAVRARSANDVWAVGAAGRVLHWDGKAWSPIAIPEIAGLRVTAIELRTNDVLLAAEGGLVVRRSGTRTDVLPTGFREGLVHSIATSPSGTVWLAGSNDLIIRGKI
jgi:hypothetical protein